MATKAKDYKQEGYRTLTPHLVIKGAADAIEFYKKAFNATEIARMPGPGGKIMHAEMQIGDCRFMLADEMPEYGVKSPTTLGGSPVDLFLYVPDVDASFKQAIAAGATETMPVADQFWGDRYGKLNDPFGHRWSMATHKEELTEQEIMERAQKFMSASA